MSKDLSQIIRYDAESSVLDFKKEEYSLGKNSKRNELLKDISAFANHHSDVDKYIIIGIEEENGIAKGFFPVENLTDEAKYQNFILDNIEPRIIFEYKSAVYEGNKIAYFRIFGNKNRPYLFKKDVKNPINDKTDFRIGDGYIKVGSSSKKINRTDFENIYKARSTEKDRRGDLKVEAYYGTSNDERLDKSRINYLDIKITNHSNKSIEFDIEMKIFKGHSYDLIPEDELLKGLEERDSHSYMPIVALAHLPNMDIHFQDEDDYVLISRNTRSKRTAINLPQNSIENDVFCQYLFVVQDETNDIKAQITIRSDDFTEGPLIQDITFTK